MQSEGIILHPPPSKKKIISMLCTFPRAFSQEATFKGYFPVATSQMSHFPSNNFPSLF